MEGIKTEVHIRFDEVDSNNLDDLVKEERLRLNTSSRKVVSRSSVIRRLVSKEYQQIFGNKKEEN